MRRAAVLALCAMASCADTPPADTWARAFGSSTGLSFGRAVAVGTRGDLYVAGSFTGRITLGAARFESTGERAFLASLSPTGEVQWARAFPMWAGGDEGTSLVADGEGGVVVTTGVTRDGRIEGDPSGTNVSAGACVVALDRSGRVRWARSFGNEHSYGTAIARASDGDLVVAAVCRAPVDFGTPQSLPAFDDSACVIRWSPAGERRWGRVFPAPARGDGRFVVPSAVGIDASGRVTLAGRYAGEADLGVGGALPPVSTTFGRAFLMGLGDDGAPRWVQPWGAPARIDGLTIDPSGNADVVANVSASGEVAGRSVEVGPEGDLLVASVDASGAMRWLRHWPNAGNGSAITRDAHENLIVAGFFSGSLDLGGGPTRSRGNYDAFAASLTPEGSTRWTRTWGDFSADYLCSVGMLPGGAAVLVGHFFQVFSAGDITLSGPGNHALVLRTPLPP